MRGEQSWLQSARARGYSDQTAAVEATTDLFIAYREMVEGRDPDAVEHLIDKWVQYKPGCTLADEFCGNGLWLDVLREKQTGPYLGCGQGIVGAPEALALMLLALLAIRQRMRRRYVAER